MDGKINVLTADILKNPQGQVLLIPHFSDSKQLNFLFNKVDRILNDKLTKRVKQFSFKSKKGEIFVVHDVETKIGYDAILVFGMGKSKANKISSIRKVIGKSLRKIASLRFNSVSMAVDESANKDQFELGQGLSEALYLSQYRFNKYKSVESKKKEAMVREMNLYVSSKLKAQSSELEEGIRFGKIVSEGVNYVRDLVNEPAQYVSPSIIADEARKIVKNSNGTISVKVFDRKECEKLGMGAFLAVAQGSDREPQFIVLHYKGGKGNQGNRGNGEGKKICLIGKTITFDSGGLSLKPSKSMETMKLDMAGGATVLGVFRVLGELGKLGKLEGLERFGEIWGVLPACENMPSGRAIRPGDIVRALNGKTIEILNTDAEGRLILADALSYAEKYLKPDYIIDLATLTGAIMVGLGSDITGMFARDKTLGARIEKAAREEGEELWPMPLHKPYLKKMKSDIADLKNVSGGGYGGAITAALFLGEFVKKTPWVHLDIAGASFNEGEITNLIPKGGTGWGVRTLLRMLIA